MVVVSVEQYDAMMYMGEMNLVGTAREGRHECDPVFVAKDVPLPAALAMNHVAVEAASGFTLVLRLRAELSLQDRRDERIRVDLSVWMAKSHPDFLAAVLEYVDITHVREAPQLAGAIAPHLDEVADVVDALLP